MANVFLDAPPSLSGDEQQQLNQIYRYLYELSEKLTQQMSSLTVDSFDEETRSRLITVIGDSGEQTGIDTLKSLIVKTANVVRHEMDEISVTLNDSYTAISETFGTYERELTNTITETAEGILQDYHFSESITGLENSLESYKRSNSTYIFSGLLSDTENGEDPVYGIAVGENVTDYDANGEAVLNHENKVATFTKDRMSFYIGGTEVAYFSNQQFVITDGWIKNTLKIGNNHIWRVLANGALALMKN